MALPSPLSCLIMWMSNVQYVFCVKELIPGSISFNLAQPILRIESVNSVLPVTI